MEFSQPVRRSKSSAGSNAFMDPERKAFQIEGHKLETQAFENASELRGHCGIERPCQLLARDFNANNLAMMPPPGTAGNQILGARLRLFLRPQALLA